MVFLAPFVWSFARPHASSDGAIREHISQHGGVLAPDDDRLSEFSEALAVMRNSRTLVGRVGTPLALVVGLRVTPPYVVLLSG